MIKPWFLTEGKLAAVLIKPSSWGSQLDGDLHYHTPPQQRFFGRRCRGKRRLLQREFRTHTLYFVLVLLYFIFACKNTQKIVPTIVVIFVGLLLSCFIMLSINGWFL
jgi:hypothetical protein